MGPNMARDKLRRKYPHAYYAGIVSLLKVVRWDTVQRGAIDRPYTPDEIMGELEKRVGPAGCRLFEQFLRKVNKLL
jgi:hypothetical protein